MIPLRDLSPTRRTPIVTWALIGVNVLVWLFQWAHGAEGLQALVMRYGLVPNVITSAGIWIPRSEGGALGALITPITSMFMHGGWLHLIGNMWFLHIFGDNVEDALGRGRFLAFYLLGGLAAAAMQVAIGPNSAIPMVGASGAISAVMAGYVMLFPRARVVTLVPIFFFIQIVELPAFVFIFVWFGFQLLAALGTLGSAGGGVAFFAHVGGFIAGLLLVRALRPAQPKPRPFPVYTKPHFDGRRWR